VRTLGPPVHTLQPDEGIDTQRVNLGGVAQFQHRGKRASRAEALIAYRWKAA
jgi:hypothetical protein